MTLRTHNLVLARVIFVFVLGLPLLSAWGQRRVTKMPVTGTLKVELNHVLRIAADLHQARIAGKEPQVDQTIRQLLQRIRQARRASGALGHQRQHLVKMLDAASQHLQNFRSQPTPARSKSLQQAFFQLVNVAQLYQLDRYSLFLCPKDRSVWLQRGAKPLNPIAPTTHRSCGRPLPS